MEIMESVRIAFKELIFPEIEKIQQSYLNVSLTLDLTNKRLDDTNKRLDDVTAHLADQSRRIDDLRKELSVQIKDVREELGGRIDQTNVRIEAMSVNFQTRMDRLYEVIVRRDEHNKLEERVVALERDMSELKRHVAA